MILEVKSDKSSFSFAAVALLLFVVAIFILAPYYSVILDGDELHSIIFSSGNRANYDLGYPDLVNRHTLAEDWKYQIFHVHEFDPLKIWDQTLAKDVHPPLYNCLLHLFLFLFGGSILGAYALNALLLIASLALISKETKKDTRSLWIIIAVLPYILTGFLDIRPYGLLFYIGLNCYFLFKENEAWSFKLLLFMTLGLLTNYLFVLFIVALFLSRVFSTSLSLSGIIKNRNFGLAMIAAIAIVFVCIGRSDQADLIFSRMDTGGHYLFDRAVNALFSLVGLTFPVWTYKLVNNPALYIVLFGLGCVVTFLFFSFFIRNRDRFSFEFQTFVIYTSLYLLLYFLGLIPHHSVGGKYFMLLTIPLIVPVWNMLEQWNYSKWLIVISFILIFTGEGLFRGNERNTIVSISDSSMSFYSNSSDVFSTLRLIQAMQDNKKIFIGELGEENIGDFEQVFITNSIGNERHELEKKLKEKYCCKKLVLRKYQEIGAFYSKK